MFIKGMDFTMTKNNIMIAALRLFLLRGYRNVSLVDVAKEIGITKGGIYHYFGSKEELFHSVICYLFDYFAGKYAEVFSKENSFRRILEFMIGGERDAYIEGLLNIKHGDYRANNASMALEIMHTFPEIQERIDHGQLELRNAVQQRIESAQAAGEIRSDLDAQTLATMILSVSSGLNVLGKNLNTDVMNQQVIEHIWKLIGGKTLKE